MSGQCPVGETTPAAPAVLGTTALGMILLVSLCAQLLPFLLGPSMRPADLFGDEPGYWALSAGPGFDFLRPPGYPVFLASVRAIAGSSVGAVLLTQSMLAAFRPFLLAAILAAAGVRNPAAVAGACVLCAVSFTSVSLSKLVMADALLGILSPAAFLLLWKGARGRSGHAAFASSAVAAAALALKPVFELWLAIAPLVSRLAGLRGAAFRRVATRGIGLPLALLLAWSSVMNRKVGVFAYSGIGSLAVSRYWAIGTESLAAHGGRWIDADVVARRSRRDSRFGIAGSVERPNRRAALASARAALCGHPVEAARVLARDFWTNLPRPFSPQELIFGVSARSWADRVGKAATYGLWVLAAAGVLTGLRRRPMRSVTLALLSFAGAFALATSISFWAGARLMYPAEWVLFALAAIAIDGATPRSNETEAPVHG